MSPALPPLTEWETFYVIVGSSAAALTGLQFVVIALGAEARVLGGEPAMKAFGTPTVVYACRVVVHARRQQGYAPVLSDWVWHAGLPLAAYTFLLVAGVTAWWRPAPALYVVAVMALWMAVKRRQQ